MREYLAHSKNKNGISQTYKEHVEGVIRRADEYSVQAVAYSACNEDFKNVVHDAAVMHDLGKLAEENQMVLQQPSGFSHLPINHVDAGSALLEKKDKFASVLVFSHHRGLPNFSEELSQYNLSSDRGHPPFRDNRPGVRKRVEDELLTMVNNHKSGISETVVGCDSKITVDRPVFMRMALSCLADADHSDTAEFYGQYPKGKSIPLLNAVERLEALNKYVSSLGGTDERSRLRQKMYQECRDCQTDTAFAICDSPVGSGKTTAVMAHMLSQANVRGMRRIFVVLPYTSIIQQSVEIYRKALVLPGEDPESVVAELHCRADFQDDDIRYLTSLWEAPIIVTTAVAFFETLASNKPSTLRRLHFLPGSAIFIDESHNALPLRLIPIAWHWMNVLGNEWGCYWVLASGSLVKFWDLNSLDNYIYEKPNIKSIVKSETQQELAKYEKGRIEYKWKDQSLSRHDLVDWVTSFDGPKLLIVNTVQTAAVIACEICKKTGRKSVEHLSTALNAEDRKKTIDKIKKRLSNENDSNWTLVATSCVEAGVDFSFKVGFREIGSFLSLIQAAGRVNRDGKENEAKMWSFSLKDDSMLTKNPSIQTSAEILKKKYLKECKQIKSQLSTEAVQAEIGANDSIKQMIKELEVDEKALEFQSVADKFRVIDNKLDGGGETVLCIVDKQLAKEVESGTSDWKKIQQKAISVNKNKVKRMKCLGDGLYFWDRGYDTFVGYMHDICEKLK